MKTRTPPLVSVVLATHNAAETLGVAIASVLRQTLDDIELIVVDDCSTDRTEELLSSVDDLRLVVLRNDAQLGLAGSLNRGFDRARGRYVARLDADDVALPTRLVRQARTLQAGLGIALVGSGALELGASGVLGRLHVMPAGDASVRWQLLFSCPFFHPAVMVDLDLLTQHGLRYDTSFLESEDYDLWARLLRVTRGDNLTDALLLKRVHPGQATQRRRDLQRSFQRQVALREIRAVAPELGEEGTDLAWALGSNEPVPEGRLVEAADALEQLLRSFGAGRTGVPRAVRGQVARTLASAGLGAEGRVRSELLRRALRLDPALPVTVAARRTRRASATREARREAATWLRSLDRQACAPVSVTVVSPEPTPYRAPLFDRVAARPEVELTVIYAARTVADRTWEVVPSHRALLLRGVRLPGFRRLLRHDYPVTPGILGALDDARPDVVVVSGWSTFASQAAIAWCRARRVPYLLLVSSHDRGVRASWRGAVRRAIVPRVVRGAAGGLVLGTLSRASLVANGMKPDRVHIFANTVDVDAWGKRADQLAERRPALRAILGVEPDDLVVLSVGRLAPEKGLDTLVRAAAEAGDSRIALVLVGSGPERDGLERLARELGVRLVLAGDVPHYRLPEIYASADVFALLSLWEPWGVVVNEAAASGLPLVLSDQVGAAFDLLRDGENGALVPAGNVASAAAALRRLASDPVARRAAAARSRDLVGGWGYGPSVEAFVAAVREAAAR